MLLYGHKPRRTEHEWRNWILRRRLAAIDYEKRKAREGTSRRVVSGGVNVRDRYDKITAHVIRYWQVKNANPGFHSGGWGGWRWAKCTILEEWKVRVKIYLAAKIKKTVDIGKLARLASYYVTHLRRANNINAPALTLSSAYIRRVFAEWGWTWKVPIRCQLAKFSPANIRLYIHYTIGVSYIPYRRIKFLDEFHLDHRGTSKTFFTASFLFSAFLVKR